MPRPNWDESYAEPIEPIVDTTSIPAADSFKDEKEHRLDFSFNNSWKSPTKNNINFSTDDINSLISKIKNIQEYLNSDLIIKYNELKASLSNINAKTGEKFLEKTNKNILVQQEDLKEDIDDMGKLVDDIIEMLNNDSKTMHGIDEGDSGAASELPPKIPIAGSNGQSSGSNSHNSQNSADTEIVEEIVKVPNYDEIMQQYSSIIVATVLFSEIVPLYEVIGDPTSVESITNTDIYKLIGIQKEEGKYYFKILDSSTGKIYFAEINDKVKIDWDQLGERKAIEIIGDNVFIMKQPETEGDILERIAKIGDIFFLNDDNISVDGIDYYNIDDSMTGKKLYIPISDSIAKPDLISNIISTMSNGSGVSK